MDEAMPTVVDEVEAEDTITLERTALLTEDYATLLVLKCSTTAKSWQQTKQDHHGRNSCNTLARIMDKA